MKHLENIIIISVTITTLCLWILVFTHRINIIYPLIGNFIQIGMIIKNQIQINKLDKDMKRKYLQYIIHKRNKNNYNSI